MGKLDRKQLFWGAVAGVVSFGFMIGAYNLGYNQGKKQVVLGESESQEITEREVDISILADCSEYTERVEIVDGKERNEYCTNYVEGETAFDVLKRMHEEKDSFTFGYEESDFGSFVTSINNYHPDVSDEYWSFYINEEMSIVGVSDYTVKDGDMLMFRVEKISF